jgi:hypothetical protein
MTVPLAADLVSMQGAVDGGAGDAEKVGELGGACVGPAGRGLR